jgi:hypothetical protein
MQKPNGQSHVWVWISCGVLLAWLLPYILLRTVAPREWTFLIAKPSPDITLADSVYPRSPMREWMSEEAIDSINTVFCKLPGEVDLMITGRAVTF